jgi:hypothetical protein
MRSTSERLGTRWGTEVLTRQGRDAGRGWPDRTYGTTSASETSFT